MIDTVDDLDGVCREIDETGFEPVQRLDTERDTVIARQRRESPQLRAEVVEVSLPLISSGLPRPADSAVQRPDEIASAEQSDGLDAVLEVSHSVLAARGIRMDEIAIGAHRGTHADGQAMAARDLRRRSVIDVTGPLNRQFDQVEPHLRHAWRESREFGRR